MQDHALRSKQVYLRPAVRSGPLQDHLQPAVQLPDGTVQVASLRSDEVRSAVPPVEVRSHGSVRALGSVCPLGSVRACCSPVNPRARRHSGAAALILI